MATGTEDSTVAAKRVVPSSGRHSANVIHEMFQKPRTMTVLFCCTSHFDVPRMVIGHSLFLPSCRSTRGGEVSISG
jgi:hypothetical protein